jgi:hypothetical protein
MAQQKKSSNRAKKSPEKEKINPDDFGVSKEEADEIIAELDDMTDEEIEERAREADR